LMGRVGIRFCQSMKLTCNSLFFSGNLGHLEFLRLISSFLLGLSANDTFFRSIQEALCLAWLLQTSAVMLAEYFG